MYLVHSGLFNNLAKHIIHQSEPMRNMLWEIIPKLLLLFALEWSENEIFPIGQIQLVMQNAQTPIRSNSPRTICLRIVIIGHGMNFNNSKHMCQLQ